MSSYEIKKKQLANAKKLGVELRVSTDKLKKIDVYEKLTEKEIYDGKVARRLASIGGFYQDGTPYGDYATYLKKPKDKYGEAVKPEERKRLYLARHKHEEKSKRAKDGTTYKTPSYWADKILWE
tara:strand:- start:679 stop:1050 length:372 start_codon:yes stop_codon:yes gene_type:complete